MLLVVVLLRPVLDAYPAKETLDLGVQEDGLMLAGEKPH